MNKKNVKQSVISNNQIVDCTESLIEMSNLNN